MVRWEGSWTPSERKQDRPNASETLEIIGFEPFLPDRSPGGKIFMYWTARCTRDPWLQSGACNPFGAYVPDDLRQAFTDIDKQSFPRTATIISAADKQRLYAEYQRANHLIFRGWASSGGCHRKPCRRRSLNPLASLRSHAQI